MQKNIFLGLLLALLAGACVTTDQARLAFVREWEGKSAAEVLNHFGPPGQILEDGQGGRLLLYGPGAGTDNLQDFQRQGSYFRRPDLDHIFWINPQGDGISGMDRHQGPLLSGPPGRGPSRLLKSAFREEGQGASSLAPPLRPLPQPLLLVFGFAKNQNLGITRPKRLTKRVFQHPASVASCK